MLAYVLALVVGLSSFALYMAAFFFPEVHRKHDFIWSGVGLFYALVLWVCAGRITGGVLLGQTASIALLGWLGWQTLTLRRQVAPLDQRTIAPSSTELQATLSQTLSNLAKPETIAQFSKPLARQYARLRAWIEALVATTTKPTNPSPPEIEPEPYVPLTPADFADAKRNVKPAADTITTDATPIPTSTGGSSQSASSPLTSITKQVQDTFKGLTKKRESKPVYVRKQFRAPEPEPPSTAAVETESSDDRPLEPMPTELSSTDVVDAAIVDAVAKELSTAPPVDPEIPSDESRPQ